MCTEYIRGNTGSVILSANFGVKNSGFHDDDKKMMLVRSSLKKKTTTNIFFNFPPMKTTNTNKPKYVVLSSRIGVNCQVSECCRPDVSTVF